MARDLPCGVTQDAIDRELDAEPCEHGRDPIGCEACNCFPVRCGWCGDLTHYTSVEGSTGLCVGCMARYFGGED